MNRRTVLSFLAALPGFAFLAPKKAEAFPVRTHITVPGPDDFKPKKIGYAMYDRMPHIPGTHRLLFKMLADIRRHVAANPGCEVLLCDEPKCGQIGYAVGSRDEYLVFTISVLDLKRRFTLLGYTDAECDTLRHLIRSSAGRLHLAKILQAQSQLPS
jgi:hypothetical protein